MPSTPLRLLDVVPALAAIGAAGGLFAADLFGLDATSFDDGLRLLLCLVTPLSAAALGAWLAGRLSQGPVAAGAAVFLGVFVAGAANGTVIGVCAGGPMGALFGLVIGLLCAAPFLPVVAVVAAAAVRVGRARRGSIVDGVDRRGILRAAFVGVAGTALLVGRFERSPGLLADAHGVIVLAMLALGAVIAVDLGALARVRLLVRTLRRAPVRPRFEAVPEGVRALDFGVGDAVLEVAAVASYRTTERPRRVFRGSPELAIAALHRALAADVALALAGTVAAWQLVPT